MYTKLLKTVFILFISLPCFSQVGIGTDAPRGALEINSSTNGFLPPQVTLTASNVSAPVVNPQGGGVPIAGTIVYNTAISGVTPNNVVPGYYYWNGSNWLLLTSQSSSSPSQWSLTGNTGTSAATNFIGTTDNTDFVTRTNSVERVRVTGTGNVGVGISAPSGKMHVLAVGSDGNPGVWDSSHVVFGETGSTGNGLGLGFNTATAGSEYGFISSLKPGSAWKDLKYRALNHIFYNGGFNEVFRTSGTYVGIGTVAPIGRLDVVDNVPSALTRSRFFNDGAASRQDIQIGANGAGNVYLGVDGANSIFGSGVKSYLDNRSGGRLVFGSNGNEYVTMSVDGKLGIGTSSPASKLDVAAGITTAQTAVNVTGSINDFFQMNVQNSSTGTQAQSGYSATANNGTATTGFAWMGINNSNFNFPSTYNIGGANDVSYIGSGQDMYIANANNSKSIIFSTGTATSPFFNERMRITNAGNVGVGTNNPTTKLHINSTSSPALRIVDGSQGAGKILVSDANGNASWQASGLPSISAFQDMVIPICANVSVGSTGSFITTISGVSTTVSWTVLSKQTSSASFPITAERLQVRYNFSPQLPFVPKGIIFNALNNSGYPDTFSLNYAAKSQSSITVNVTRNDTLGNGAVSCWAGQFYFDVMIMN
ncbi:hypothetical protein [Flavobacterium oreochromis]|uniref:Uncharacterized protein n=1 Tax=Flavobacterium columnare TaxID=996 RepID=A0A246G991_9FLAO|nr:hypothetical protein [Flavobacterium oreochromis]OWP75953.1 hypothetical protein BWK62_10875 [Flavobacterium oreochromis]